MVFMFVFVLGNAYALQLLFPVALQHEVDDDGDYDDSSAWMLSHEDGETVTMNTGSIGDAAFTSFNMMFQSFDPNVLQHSYSPLTAQICYMVYVLVVHVVMLNMAIALMSADFAEVSDNIEEFVYRHLAMQIVNLESVLQEEKQNDPELFPRWLCWYQPAEKEEKADRFQDKLVKALVNDKEKLLKDTDEKIDKVAKDMDKKLDRVLRGLDEVKNVAGSSALPGSEVYEEDVEEA
jgi:hypothetical protein